MKRNYSYKVTDVLESLDPETRGVIKTLAEKTGDKDVTIRGLISSGASNRSESMALLALLRSEASRFAPKLSFQRRCEILALYKRGIPRETLARLYGVDRRTVTHIYNPLSPHYKNVRDHYVGLGEEQFFNTYLTEEVMNRALIFHNENTEAPANSKHAKQKAGLHYIRGHNCEHNHRVKIEWRNSDAIIETAGWYYCDLDGDFPDKW